MKIDKKFIDKNLQHDINREATKISALPSGHIDKYKYITGEIKLPFNQGQMAERVKFTYSPIGKASEKQTKTTEA